jgi:hypothetical protein
MTATSPVESAPLGDVDLYLDLYRRMRLIRGFEDLVQSLFLRGEIYGTTHLYSGQEAVAVGFASVLGDRTASPPRTAVTDTRSRSASTRRSCSTRCSAGRRESTAASPAP